MGDGGVAFAPSQHVMATISETFCGGGGGGGFNSKAVKFTDSNSAQQRKGEKMELEKGEEIGEFGKESKEQVKSHREDVENGEIVLEEPRKGVAENGEVDSSSSAQPQTPRKVGRRKDSEREELGSEKGRKSTVKKGHSGLEKARKVESGKLRKGEVENGEIVPEKQRKVGAVEKGEIAPEKLRRREIEKGEIVSEKLRKGDMDKAEDEIEKGEFVPDKWRRGEIEKGEFVIEKSRRAGLEREEYSHGRIQRGEIEKGEFVPEKWRREELDKSGIGRGRREEEVEKGEFIPDRWRNGDVEKGEIVSDKWRKGEAVKEEFSSGRGRRREVEKGEFIPGKGWKDELDRTPKKETTTSVKFGDRSGSDQRRRSSRWESSNERDLKSSSRIVDGDLGLHKHEYSDGKNHGREHSFGTWPKRDVLESEGSNRKNHGDFGEYLGCKSRRISDDNNHSTYSDKLHSSVERSYRNVSLSSKVSTSSRYASRLYESSSRGGGSDRRGRSPYHERSPHDRVRYQNHRDRSPARPSYSDRSPHDRARYQNHRDRSPARAGHHDHRDRTPGQSERSPHDRGRHRDHRERTPAHLERSPRDRARHRDYKERSPAHSERSPHDGGRHHDHKDQSPRPHEHREGKRKSGVATERQHSQFESQGHEEKLGQRESAGRDSHRHSTGRRSHDGSCLHNSSTCPDKDVDHQASKGNELQDTMVCNELSSQANDTHEEFQSMEEDMDICDTPPHVPVVANSSLGKWFYLDHFGIEQGPSKLCVLRRLVEEGLLQSDHLIKHAESDRWVTVENAASPLVPVNLRSVVSDTVTELVNPPEAPGNLLVDIGDVGSPMVDLNESSATLESLDGLDIDERVRALLKGYTVIPGKELETLGEALHTMFEHVDWERWGASSEGFTRSRGSGESSKYPRDEDFSRGFNSMLKDLVETRSGVPSGECLLISSDSSDWFSSLWSCKGGDWKRNDEVAQDRCLKRKLVLNEGYPLCQMPKSGYEDPRWHRKDDLYFPSHSKRLDLPHWAFTLVDEKNDTNGDIGKSVPASRSIQLKPSVVRGVKGTILPVVRINACVVKDHGSFVSDPRIQTKGNDRHCSRSIRSFSTSSSDGRSSSMEPISESRKVRDSEPQALHKCRAVINIPKDHVCRVDELQLDLGDWYYLDGAGHERGPLSFSELQSRVAQGIIPKYSSVFRKIDKVWVPITSAQMGSETVHAQTEGAAPTADSSSVALLPTEVAPNVMEMVSSSFHSSHPQFIGYTRGKLHELVMKSYRSREFAAAINEVLDPWMSARQPKKEMDKHFPFNSSISDLANDLSVYKFRKPEGSLSRIYNDYSRAGKRARFLVDESDEDDEMEGDALTYQKIEFSFEDLCGEGASVQTESESWGLLGDTILARVFHFLRSDLRSLAFSAATCKCWSTAVKFYRDISRQVDLSSMGSDCTDSMFQNIMSGYEKTKITSIVLMGCTNVSAAALEEVLQSFPCISSVDIRGCSQFRELMYAFKNIKWVRSRGSCNSKILEESHSKMRSLRQITEKNSLNSKAFRGSSGHFDGSVELGLAFDDDSNLDRKDAVSYALRQNCYKRRKLLNGRKPSAVLSRDAHMRRWLHRKSGNEYKKVEEFLAISLKDIMKENKSEFFVTKVSEIEDRMRNGYYIGHGLSSVKEDISRMCRDAIKARSRGDARDMNHIIMLFIRLVKSLEENLKSSNDREDALKMLKDSSVAGLSSTASKYKKRNSNIMSERKAMIRSNGTFSGMDFADYASDREIRRRLSKLNKRSFDSESETSDDLDLSEDNGRSDAENTDSDTESDLEFHSEGRHADMRDGLPFVSDESFDTMTEDREWGARMTKAGLVPPVTRKYEVIDRYVILADEELVQRKMQVALPDDYAEKLIAQKNGIEEADMEIPEVKDYKPRKRLGDEVLEQEVYGIDPYTHNLLLDSMPEESEWPQSERHLFIEEVLLRALNKQVRHFTGTGNTPMMYSLQPVLEEVLKTAEEEGDTRIMKMCQCILKAIRNRPEDTYVAYRKGLGVVCNKEEGFGEDDFVVEFLGEVYPAWKWFEKQDGIRSLQKNSKDPAPEFYNIYLERPKGDRDGYDLVVVDAMHKANYASRICHSCRPNCEAKVTAVDGQYQIGIYSVRPICYGEEITFDYNSVTESKEEFKASVCLCGSQVCRGSYLNLTGEGAFQKVFKECHGILDRHQLLLEACEVNCVSQEDYIDLGRAGLGTCLLDGLPEWLIAYSAHLVRFINFERTKLPEEILKHNLEEKRKFFSDICLEVEKSDAEIQAEGVYNQRLQNLALTLDKVRYVMRSVFGDARKAPPPLEKLSPEALVSLLWKGEGSLVQELLQCMAPHMEADSLNDLTVKILAHDPSGSNDLQSELQKSLLWLRDEIRNLPCTYKSRHDAAADLIHIYAHTKCFFKVQDYKSITSPPVYISPLDLGPKYADKLGSGFQEYCKTYGENYCLGQLIYWHIQTNAEPDRSLARARRGCLSLPDAATFYTKSQKPSRKHVYGPRTLKFMLARMEKQPQRPWPKDHIWTFKSSPQIFGSPMFDAVLNKSALDREMLQWLRSRPFVFQAMWDR